MASKKRNINDVLGKSFGQLSPRENSNSLMSDSALSSKKKKLSSENSPSRSEGERVNLDLYLLKPINPVASANSYKKKDSAKKRPVTDKLYNAFYDAPFEIGESVPLSFLVNTYETVSQIKGESSQKQIKDALANMFRSILLLNPAELHLAYYFSIAKFAPDFEKDNMLGKFSWNSPHNENAIFIGVGNETTVKAISKATGCSEKQLREQAVKLGDLGKAAALNKSSQSTMDRFFKKNAKKEPLTVNGIIFPQKTHQQT